MRDFAMQIERETDHLAQLVDELLDLSMIESSETKLAVDALDPNEVVAACVERIRPVAERREIQSSAFPALAMLSAPRPITRLGQALLNLAHNAVKYSMPGGEVRIGWEPSDSMVRFSVADDGIGVPEAHQERIFERFYKVDRSRARDDDARQLGGSAGLGLAIVRHIAEAHRGAVGLRRRRAWARPSGSKSLARRPSKSDPTRAACEFVGRSAPRFDRGLEIRFRSAPCRRCPSGPTWTPRPDPLVGWRRGVRRMVDGPSGERRLAYRHSPFISSPERDRCM